MIYLVGEVAKIHTKFPELMQSGARYTIISAPHDGEKLMGVENTAILMTPGWRRIFKDWKESEQFLEFIRSRRCFAVDVYDF